MGKRDTGVGTTENGPDPEKIYTDPEQAKLFVEETGIDALASSKRGVFRLKKMEGIINIAIL